MAVIQPFCMKLVNDCFHFVIANTNTIHYDFCMRITPPYIQGQYVFLHDAILEGYTSGDTEIVVGKLAKRMTELEATDDEGILLIITLMFTLLKNITIPVYQLLLIACYNIIANYLQCTTMGLFPVCCCVLKT